MLKTGLKPRKLYLLHVLWSDRILFEQTSYSTIVHSFMEYTGFYPTQCKKSKDHDQCNLRTTLHDTTSLVFLVCVKYKNVCSKK